MSNLTKCAICDAEYSYCPNCAGYHGWRFYTDTREHYQIYMIIKQYTNGVLNKEEARIAFQDIGITDDSNLHGLKEDIIKAIKDIVTIDDKIDEKKTVLKKTKKSKLYKDE